MAEPGYYVRTQFHYLGGRVGFVDSAREKNKARAVVGICMNRGRYPIRACALLIPLIENRKSKIKNRKKGLENTPLPWCAPAASASSRISVASLRRKRKIRRGGAAAEVLYEGAECDVDMGLSAGQQALSAICDSTGTRPGRGLLLSEG